MQFVIELVHLVSPYGAHIWQVCPLTLVILHTILVQLHQYQVVLISVTSLYNAVSFIILCLFIITHSIL